MRNYDKSYNAIAGQQYSESLPVGYASAVFVNQSGHYVLVRVGALSAPSNIQSAEHLIPPNAVAAINLRSQYVAFTFTDLVTGLTDNLSTGLDGVCKVSYSQGGVVEYTQLLPGAVQAAALPVGIGAYEYATFVLDFVPGALPQLILSGGTALPLPLPPKVYLRRAYAVLTEDITTGGNYFFGIGPLAPPHAPQSPILIGGKIDTGYVPPIEFVSPAGADFRIPYNNGLFIFSGANVTGVYIFAEFRTTP